MFKRLTLLWGSMLAVGILCLPAAYCQAKDTPVGLILEARDARILHKGRPEVAATPGDLLFAGDTLHTNAEPLDFAFCPAGKPQLRFKVDTKAGIRVEHDRIVDEEKKLRNPEEIPYCRLPEVQLESEVHSKGTEDLSKRISEPGKYAKAVADLPPARRAELEKLDSALRSNPNDTLAMTSRAVLLDKSGLAAEAADQYTEIARLWGGQQWAKMLVHEKRAAASPSRPGTGTTYAVVIGISRYDNPAINNLSFAHRDAQSFADYLSSQRGHQVPQEQIKLLIDGDATLPRIQESIKFLMNKAGKDDTVVFFISGHGDVSEGEGYLVVNRTDPQNLKDTAYPMTSLFALMYEMSSKIGRFVMFVDACRSGMIGQITEKNAINQRIARAINNSSDNIMALLASHQTELAWEHKNFDEGHSVFSYFLLRGMAADGIREADSNRDGKVSLSELIRYVQNKVPDATLDKQHPDNIVKVVDWAGEELADMGTTGIKLGDWSPMPKEAFSGKAKALLAGTAEEELPSKPTAPTNEEDLERLIRLEEEGQEILLEYLRGDEIPQTGVDFARGLQVYDQALGLAPGSLYLESRKEFFHGRSLISEKNYDAAIAHLETSIRLNPRSPSPYNALGVAYLELGKYDEAVSALEAAIARAWYWSYPRHNLALAYMQMGQYDHAILAYRKAMQLAPDFSYLPYNLGLIYQKINLPQDAEWAYLEAKRLADLRARQAAAHGSDEAYQVRRAAPLIALALLKTGEGRHAQAVVQYNQALTLLAAYPSNQYALIARHDLALLYAKDKKTWPEAEALLLKNIVASYIPSEQRMAEWLAERGDLARSVPYYETLLAARPDYTAARLRVAELLEKTGDANAARNHLQLAREKDPANALVLYELAQLQSRMKAWDEARATYQAAWQRTTDPRMRARIQAGIRKLP